MIDKNMMDKSTAKKSNRLARAHRVVEALESAGLKIAFAREMKSPQGSFGIEVGRGSISVDVYHDRALMKSLGLTPDCRLVQIGMPGPKKKLVTEADVVATVLKLMLKAA